MDKKQKARFDRVMGELTENYRNAVECQLRQGISMDRMAYKASLHVYKDQETRDATLAEQTSHNLAVAI